MKNGKNIRFVLLFIGAIITCSFILYLGLNWGVKENDKEIKNIQILQNEEKVTYKEVAEVDTNYDAGRLEEKDGSKESVGKEDDNGLISGTEHKSVLLDSKIDYIAISSEVCEVIIYQGDKKELEITQTYKNLYKEDIFTVNELANIYEVKVSSTEIVNGLPVNQNVDRRQILEIKLPENYKGVLKVTKDVGNITIKNTLNISELQLIADSGNISIEGKQDYKKAYIQCDSGNVEVRDLWNISESEFQVDSGNVKFFKEVNADKIYLKLSTGNVEVRELWDVIESEFQVDSGNVEFFKEVKADKIYLKLSTGNVEVRELWDVIDSEFQVDIGNVQFFKAVNADRFLVNVSIGNISVPADVKLNKNYILLVELGLIKGY